MKIALVLGTAREGNYSTKVFEIAKKYLEDGGNEVTTVDVKDHLYGKTISLGDDPRVDDWKKAVEESDTVIFVTPEYNHSYPGELKILIDTMYSEYKGKVAGIVSLSMGPYGGVRATELLKILLTTVNFDVVNKSVSVANVQDEIDVEIFEKQMTGMLEEIKGDV